MFPCFFGLTNKADINNNIDGTFINQIQKKQIQQI